MNHPKFSLRASFVRSLAGILLFLGALQLAPGRAAALLSPESARNPELDKYCLALRPSDGRGDWEFIPFDENLEIHKDFGDTVRYASESGGEGEDAGFTEAGIGLSLELTDFSREGDTLRFDMAVESRQITGWKVEGGMFQPVFRTKTFPTTPGSGPRTVPYGEFIDLIPGDASPDLPEMCIGQVRLFIPD